MDITPTQLIQQFEKEIPLKKYLQSFANSSIESVFINQNFPLKLNLDNNFLYVINGTTGSGKDSLIYRLAKSHKVTKVKTATTRTKRPEENEEDYLWMRRRDNNESLEEYYTHLVHEYDLIEYDAHGGNFYGLPASSIDGAPQDMPLILHNEPRGAKTLYDKLNKELNVVIIFLVPDSWQHIYNRITKESHRRDKLITRLKYSREQLTISKDVTHFYLHSTENPQQYSSSTTKNGVSFLVATFNKISEDLQKGNEFKVA